MPPLPTHNHNHQQFLASFTSFPRMPHTDATFNLGARPVFEISDDDDSEMDSSTFALPASHQPKTLIDLTSDSDGEWVSVLGRSRPSHVPQPLKRIRLEPMAQGGASAHTRPTPGFPSQAHSLKTMHNPLSRANNHDQFSLPHTTGNPSQVTPTSLNAINAELPLLPAFQKKLPRKNLKPQSPAPYFFDPELEVTMYRGHGYERFPVALGTNNELQLICNKWDAAQQRRQQRETLKLLQPPTFTRTRIHDSDSESDSDTDEYTDDEEYEATHFDQLCLAAVLEVFPDAQRQFVLDKIMKHPWRMSKVRNINKLSASDSIIPQTIISELLELGSYPKQPKVTKNEALPEDGTGKTITWNRDLPKDPMYLKDAVILLAKVFDHIPTCYIHKIVHLKKSIFDAYVYLDETENRFHQTKERPYARLRMPRVAIEKKYQPTAREQRLPHSYAHRINELQAAKQHIAREVIKDNICTAKKKAEERNLQEHKAIGATAPCGCCFEDTVPLNRIVTCEGDPAHSFCFMCVSGLAETQVGLMKHEMRCMDGSICSASLCWSSIAKAVDIKTFDRLEFNKQQAEILAADLEGLEQCPFCEFKAICDTVDVDPVFACQNPECGIVSCRKCHLESHLPKSCEEHKKENDLTARHRVEEARSDAVMRTCPKCKVKIIKEDGCNKMVCSTCRALMCYECQEDLSKLGPNVYNHFNKPGAKCSLYDRVGVDRHEVEADDAEREAIRKAKAEDASIDEARLRVETGKSKPTALDLHPAHDLFVQHGNLHNNHMRDLQQRRILMLARAEQDRRDALPLRHGEGRQNRLPGGQMMAPNIDLSNHFMGLQYPAELGNGHRHAHRRMAAAEPAIENPQQYGLPDKDKGKGKEKDFRPGLHYRHRANIGTLPTEPHMRNINYALLNPQPMQPEPLAMSWNMERRSQYPAFGPLSWDFSPDGSLGPLNQPPYALLNPPPPYAPPGTAPNQAQVPFGFPLNYDIEDDYGFKEIFGRRPPPV
jgi:hypothetical protein